MNKGIYFLALGFSVLLLNSCAGVGAIVTITAFGAAGYEEVRNHNPDLKLEPISDYLKLPNIDLLSEYTSDKTNIKTSKDKKITKLDRADSTFGFDCSKLSGDLNRSKCFNDFSKALAQKDNNELNNPNIKQEKTIIHSKKADKTLKKPSLILVKKTPLKLASVPVKHIESWASAWEKRDIDSYISFYSKEFKGLKNHRGAWEASRLNALKKNSNISIKLSNIQVVQKEGERVEVNFIQKYKSDNYEDVGIKELLLEKKKSGWKIIKETWMPADTQKNDKQTADRKTQINKNLANWLKAWTNQNVSTYLSFYSDRFKASNRTLAKWKNSRRYALTSNKNLTIKLSDLQFSENKNTIEVNFIQKYSSDKHSDVGIKELVWSKFGNSWKILKETWISS